jgi:excinuclease ABC subunit C
MAVNKRIDELKTLVTEFPTQSGVYLMKNQSGKIIYVGKAKNLRSRVRSYLQDSQDMTPKTKLLVVNIVHIDFLLTKTEVEAFLLEATLIKKHRPKYNIRLKDDKTYPYIRVSLEDEFPRLYLSRHVKNDGAFYFGPYTSGSAVSGTIRFLNQMFLIRDCTDVVLKSRQRPCLNYQMQKCSAPCVKLITSADYKKDVDSVLKFLKGENLEVIDDLRRKMYQAAELEKFEMAARYRDNLHSIEAIIARQAVVSNTTHIDQDIVAYLGDERGCWIQMLHLRAGRIIGSKGHFLPHINPNDPNEDAREWLVSFLNQYYFDNFIPDEVKMPQTLGLDIEKLFEATLTERKGSLVKVGAAIDENSKRLLDICRKNAKEAYDKHISSKLSLASALLDIQKKFHLPSLPKRIECYDISHLQGKYMVGSQVVFENGEPAYDQYRKYKIKTLESSNDFAAMAEVLSRRLKHADWDTPDLIVIDGGKGQLSAVVKVLQESGKTHWPVVAMAKARTEKDFTDAEVKSSEERFFLPGRQNPVMFLRNLKALQILVHLRDEAHRFAITFHRQKRSIITASRNDS